jgi:hypothetical protein
MTKFMTNSIKLNGGTFSDFVKKTLNKSEPAEVVKTASVAKAVKVAEKAEKKDGEGKDSGQPAAEAKLVNVPTKVEGKKGGKVDNEVGPDSGQPAAEAKLVNCPEVKEEPYGKSAKTEPRFVKMSKLNPKERTFLKDYWTTLFGADYAEAMVGEQ